MVVDSTRETFKHAAIYSFAAILGRIIGFVLLPIYAHILRDIGYGVIGMIDAGLAFLMSLLGYGVSGAIIRIYHEEDEPRKKVVVSTGVILIGAVGLTVVLLAMALSKPVAYLLLGDASLYYLLCVALGTFLFDMTGQAALSILQIERRSLQYSAISLLRLFLGIGLNVYLILILRLDLLGYFLANLGVAFISAMISIWIAFHRCGRTFDRSIARKLVQFLLPLVPGSLTSWLSRQVERVLVRIQIDLGSVGILEIGYKYPILISLLISQPFMRSWHTRRTEIAHEAGAPQRLGEVFTYYLFLVLFAGLIMGVGIDLVIRIFMPEEFRLAYRVARVEVVTMILIGCYNHTRFGLYYAKHTKTMAKIRMVMSVIKVALSFLFITLWGIYGAAFSACVVAAGTLIWGTVLSQRRYRIVYQTGKIVLLVAVAVAIFVLLADAQFTHLAPVARAQEKVFPALSGLLERTPLGSFKEGKGIVLLNEKSDDITDLAVRTFLCLGFLLLLPVVHDGMRNRIAGRWFLNRRPPNLKPGAGADPGGIEPGAGGWTGGPPDG